jgi:hypothetical protein
MLLLSEICGQLHNLSVTAKFCKVIQKISAADGNFFTISFEAKDVVDFGPCLFAIANQWSFAATLETIIYLFAFSQIKKFQ